MVSVLIFSSGCASVGVSSVGTKYYVDCLTGKDTNPGTSENKAWKSLQKVNGVTFKGGDELLFKADGFWTGQLWPKGSGNQNNSIKIDMYGTGAKPIIAGMGKVRDTVKLYNQQYWEINNLEITNDASSEGDRRGILIYASNSSSIKHHIYFRNLIHNLLF